MDKLKMQTVNKADEKFKKLAAMFPNAVTETIDENGEVVRAIDKDVLMQERFIVPSYASIGTSVLFGGSINQFSFTEDFSFSIGGTSAFLTILLVSCIEELRKCGRCRKT